MDRRATLKLIAGAGLAAGFVAPPASLFAQGSRASSSLDPYSDMRWGRGFEGQRRADLGDGTYLNPVFAGDHPDPSVLRVGEDYYVTFSSFDAYPGLVIWHSRDLVNWRPVTAALRTPIGSVWAPEFVASRRPLLPLHPGALPRTSVDLRHPCRADRGAVVGAGRPSPSRPYRSRPRGRP